MKKFKKIIAMCLTAAMAMSVMCVGAFAAEKEIYSGDVFAMSTEETRARGFLIIDGDVCDLDGNVILDLTNGLTSGGCELDPEFRVAYPQKAENLSVFSARATNYIANGTFSLQLNVTGWEGTLIGNSFSPTVSKPNVYVKYASGNPTSINVGVFNTGRNTVLTWTPEILPGDYVVMYGGITGENHQLKASAEGVQGNARIQAYLTDMDEQ